MLLIDAGAGAVVAFSALDNGTGAGGGGCAVVVID